MNWRGILGGSHRHSQLRTLLSSLTSPSHLEETVNKKYVVCWEVINAKNKNRAGQWDQSDSV